MVLKEKYIDLLYMVRKRNYKSYYGFNSKRKGRRSAWRSIKGRARFTRDYTNFVANKVLAIAKYVKLFINVEYKHLDSSSAAFVSSTPSVFCLTGMAQGDTSITRNGDSVKAKSLWANWTLQGDTAAESSFVRVLFVLDTLNSGTPTLDGGTDNSVMESSGIVVMRDLHNTSRFKVLFDKTYSFSNNSNEVKRGQFFCKLNYDFTFDGTIFIDLCVNHIWRIIYSDQAINTPILIVKFRYRYIDN